MNSTTRDSVVEQTVWLVTHTDDALRAPIAEISAGEGDRYWAGKLPTQRPLLGSCGLDRLTISTVAHTDYGLDQLALSAAIMVLALRQHDTLAAVR